MQLKYFKPTEFNCPDNSDQCMDPAFLLWLDKIRGYAGIPFKINSGYRTSESNKAAGGKPDSAHLTGNAVDIACTDSRTRYLILQACFFAGLPEHIQAQIREHLETTGRISIPRIGIAKTFIHIDNSQELPQEVAWLY